LRRLCVLVLLVLLSGCGSGATSSDSGQGEVVSQDQLALQVSDLYDQIDLAFTTSFAAGIDFIIANNYPGAFDPTALQACALAKQPYLGDQITAGEPRLETLTEVPNWVGRESSAADWLLAGKTISGKVYEFDLEIDLEIIKAQVVQADNQVFLLYGWCDD